MNRKKDDYPKKFNSMMFILNKLDQNEQITVNSLMDDLRDFNKSRRANERVSERTVYRYLKTLRDVGFSIYYDRKRNSYRFDEGYGLRRPNITLEERLAIALSKKMLEGSGLDISLDSVEDKLSAKSESISGHIVIKSKEPSAYIGKYINLIHTAIDQYKVLKLNYRALYSDKETLRKVEPHYLFFSVEDRSWYLRAFCHLRKDLRTFALDSIISLDILDENFPPINISKPDELNSSFGSWLDGDIYNVTLRFDEGIKQYILKKRWHGSQQNKELKDGRLEVKFKVAGLDEIRDWIIRWIPYVEVVKPKKLKDMIHTDLKNALKKFKS
jgi:predicted DNA-binding transcriptional regulator YafY